MLGSMRRCVWLLLLTSIACSKPAETTDERDPSSGGSVAPSSTPPPSEAPPPEGPAEPQPEAEPEALPPLATGLCHGQWCWVNPLPQGNALFDIEALSSTDIWAVGGWGTVMHFDGSGWTAESIGSAKLHAVWARAVDDVWVIGDDGLVARRSAGAWQLLTTGTAALHDIDGLGESVWIVGDGVAYRWDGGELIRDVAFPNQSNHSIEVIAADDIWVGGSAVHRFDGERWTRDETSVGPCADIHGFAPDDVWCVDEAGRLFHWDGKGWFAAAERGLIRYRDFDDVVSEELVYVDGQYSTRFIGRAPDDLYATGKQTTLHWDGTKWREYATLPKWLNASTVTESGVVLGVGNGGRIVSARGSSPAAVSLGLEFSIQHIVVDRQGQLVVAGYGDTWGRDGKLARLVDGKLEQTQYRGPIDGLVGRNADDLWLVGPNGVVRHFDGVTWTTSPTGTTNYLRSLWIGERIGWAVGDAGTIVRWDGSVWAPVASPVDATISAIWAAGPDDAWALCNEGKEGLILRWDGQSWTIAERGLGRLHAIDGLDAQHVWIGGEMSLRRWDGVAWKDVPGRTPTSVAKLDVLAADDIWALGGTQIQHFDGTVWTTETIGIGVHSLRAEPRRVWIGGDAGALLVRER
jgi:hypothetical protein